jgi:hypothetical protein
MAQKLTIQVGSPEFRQTLVEAFFDAVMIRAPELTGNLRRARSAHIAISKVSARVPTNTSDLGTPDLRRPSPTWCVTHD